MKRYVEEDGSGQVRAWMSGAERWFLSRLGMVEVGRAIGQVDGLDGAGLRRFRTESGAFDVVELGEELATEATELAVRDGLRTLDAIQLAAALALPGEALALASWDDRLRAAAASHGIAVLPELRD